MVPVWPGFETGAVKRVAVSSFIIKQREARRNLCRQIITKIKYENCGFGHDLIDSTLQEITWQIVLIQNLDQKYLKELMVSLDGSKTITATVVAIESNSAWAIASTWN